MIGTKEPGHEDHPQLYIDPFVGYRMWLVTEDLDLTGCIYNEHVHRPDRDVPARCEQKKKDEPRHSAPYATHTCGYWAFNTFERVSTFTVGTGKFIRGVRGVCIGWGRMVLCEHGFRAQFVRPVALLHWPDRRDHPGAEVGPDGDVWNERAERVAERYRIPYVPDSVSLEAVAHDYGAPI